MGNSFILFFCDVCPFIFCCLEYDLLGHTSSETFAGQKWPVFSVIVNVAKIFPLF